jgi:DNA-binding MurR/RpiR family transcriptional regulator
MVHIDPAMNEHLCIAGIRKEIKVFSICDPASLLVIDISEGDTCQAISYSRRKKEVVE